MYTGVIIRESLENPAVLESLSTSNVRQVEIDNPAPDQSPTWTLIDFQIPDDKVGEISELFASALKSGTWYIDMNNNQEIYVIFKNKILKYKKGDDGGKNEVKAYARSLGIPESQLGWEE